MRDTDVLQLESSMLQLNMMKIEGNVQRMQLYIEQWLQKNGSKDDPELQDLEPLELEDDVPLPECERNPIPELSLQAANITRQGEGERGAESRRERKGAKEREHTHAHAHTHALQNTRRHAFSMGCCLVPLSSSGELGH